MEPKCCKIECDKLAEYEVRPVTGEDRRETQACGEHIHVLLTDAMVHEVVRLSHAFVAEKKS